MTNPLGLAVAEHLRSLGWRVVWMGNPDGTVKQLATHFQREENQISPSLTTYLRANTIHRTKIKSPGSGRLFTCYWPGPDPKTKHPEHAPPATGPQSEVGKNTDSTALGRPTADLSPEGSAATPAPSAAVTSPAAEGVALLTPAEAQIAADLGRIFNNYLTLPVEHPMAAGEFCRAIHAAQRIVLARPGTRQLNNHHLPKGTAK